MKIFLKLILLITVFVPFLVKAGLIRDSEIEETVNLVIWPVIKAAGLKNLKIFIIDNKTPNAFTAGGENIFIHSGLIIDFPDPDVLRGVIAHEIGHITGQHVIRRQEVIDNYSKAALGATAIGLATALSGGGADAAIAIALGGSHVADRSIRAYSRTFESSADQTALSLLEKSKHSAIGMVKFFESMRIHSKKDFVNPYDQTHPLTQDRLTVLNSYLKRSKYPVSQNDELLKYKYARSSAKLAAFTLELDKILDCSFDRNVDELTNYMKAIKCFRLGSFDDAINHLNRLLKLHPNDPYYHELKGQVLFEAGEKLAMYEYETAHNLRPNDILIKLGKAVVGITFSKNDPRSITKYYQDLVSVQSKEPDNLLALYYLSIYYDKKGLKGKNYLNSAIIAMKSGNYKQAKKLAKAALKELDEKSPDWYKASDILDLMEE